MVIDKKDFNGRYYFKIEEGGGCAEECLSDHHVDDNNTGNPYIGSYYCRNCQFNAAYDDTSDKKYIVCSRLPKALTKFLF